MDDEYGTFKVTWPGTPEPLVMGLTELADWAEDTYYDEIPVGAKVTIERIS
jgi:hypothetical protein